MDRRRVIAYLSERGLSLYEQLARVVGQGQADLLAALGDEGELSRLLSRLSEVLAGPARPGAAVLAGPRLQDSAEPHSSSRVRDSARSARRGA
jgi:hypothetical protein